MFVMVKFARTLSQDVRTPVEGLCRIGYMIEEAIQPPARHSQLVDNVGELVTFLSSMIS